MTSSKPSDPQNPSRLNSQPKTFLKTPPKRETPFPAEPGPDACVCECCGRNRWGEDIAIRAVDVGAFVGDPDGRLRYYYFCKENDHPTKDCHSLLIDRIETHLDAWRAHADRNGCYKPKRSDEGECKRRYTHPAIPGMEPRCPSCREPTFVFFADDPSEAIMRTRPQNWIYHNQVTCTGCGWTGCDCELLINEHDL